MLSERRRHILSALIEEYVARALPVGSRTLSENYHLGVSSATVRNEMSVLEEAGYIAQPHTSAGRIPTDRGYRAFVDELLAREAGVESELSDEIVRKIEQQASELDDLIELTSQALCRLTDCLSIVIPPSIVLASIKQVSIVSLNCSSALLILVTSDGQILNRSVEFSYEVSALELTECQNFFTQLLKDKALIEIKSKDVAAQIGRFHDSLKLHIYNEMLACLNENENIRPHTLGLSSLLKKPEFAQADALLPLMEALEDEKSLVDILEDAPLLEKTTVIIGSEHKDQSLGSLSLVATPFGKDASAGLVAVIGPTRMNYSRALAAVCAAKRALDKL